MELVQTLQQLNTAIANDCAYNSSAIVESFGFELVAQSGRAVVRDSRGKYYKLEGTRYGNSVDEHDRYRKIRKSKYRRFFAKITLVCPEVQKVQFVRGELLSDLRLTLPADTFERILAEKSTVVEKVGEFLGSKLIDTGAHNVIYDSEADKWFLIDY